MLRAIVIASLALGASAQTSPQGMATCLCLTALPESIPRYECSYDWAADGMCVDTVGLTTNFTSYAADYGTSCKEHKEPGHSSCFDLTKSPPVEKAISDQADWCPSKWCYVDPCACDAPDATNSDYFPSSLHYSYATCGDKNTYTAVESATNTVGNAKCASEEAAPAAGDAPAAADSGTTAAPSDTSDAQGIKMGLGLLLAGMGTLA